MVHSAAITLETELIEGLAPMEALRRARAALRAGDAGARVAAFYLADLAERRGFLELGYPSMRRFAEEGLRYPEQTVRNLVTAGRALGCLPEMQAALASGRLNWTQVRALLPIATPETERAWIEWAEPRTGRQISAHVARREKGDLPTATERRRIHEPRQKVGASLTPTEYEVWRRAREKLEAQCGGPVSDRDMMIEAAQLLLRMHRDGTLPGWEPVADEHYLVHVWPRTGPDGAPELVTLGEDREEVRLDPSELTATRRRRSLISSQALDAAESGVQLFVDPANQGSPVPLERRDAPTPPGLRREVLERDGICCRSCGSRDHLAAHHLVWLCHGGRTLMSNLVTLCEACHSLIHARLLIVVGEPDGELRFLRRDGAPREQLPALPIELPIVTAPAAPPSSRVELVTLPDEADADWWERHAHLFAWSERQGELVLTPGHARVPDEGPPPGRALAEQAAADGGQRGLSALVGQAAVRERLEVAIAAARTRDEPLRHLLLAGPPGLGKTSLARAIAGELGAALTLLPAPHVRTPEALVRALVSLPGGGVLFLDEVHALPVRAAEVIYEALDRGVLSLPVREGMTTRVLRLRLRPFTLVAATTDPEQLPAPLLSRLRTLRLDPYSPSELMELVCGAAAAAGLELTPEGAHRLALASRGTPRRALALLEAVRDEVAVAGVVTADLPRVERALAREGVDAAGLDPIERRYLRELEQARGPRSLRTLAARLQVSEEALQKVHEPFLLRGGWIRITPGGRVLGRDWRVVGAPPDAGPETARPGGSAPDDGQEGGADVGVARAGPEGPEP